ncbi:hypothetical protein [Candidatus Solirubrobacter pratensis]|uniref:hypothetical protein n=1 Tax=Candidatus Solirubrobacter pratensis TaxID=1298857 RepID=UPI00041A1AF0|nr:hypothetical protein [Candidatus Solirubrobacter pratensis]
MRLDQFIKRVQYMLAPEMENVSDPEGDVDPAYFFRIADDKIRRVPIPRHAFSSETTKNLLAEVIADVTLIGRPEFICLETTAYMATFEMDKLTPDEQAMIVGHNMRPARLPNASQAPNRTEWLHLICLSRTEQTSYGSKITRSPLAPPQYGRWQEIGITQGMLLDPLKRAMASL